MSYYEKAQKIANFLKSKIETTPDYAIILGSGLGAFAKTIQMNFTIQYKEIDGFPVSTVKGHEGKLIFGTVQGKTIVAMQGRFHLYEGYDIQDTTLPIMVFYYLGVKNLIVTNAAGGVNTSFEPTDLMIIDDHISFFAPSPLVKWHKDGVGERFPSMTEPYSKKMRETLIESANKCGIDLKTGVYCYQKGPAFETPAEIKAIRNLGGDAVGMSTVPEVILANYLGMNVLGISCITNLAAGILNQPLTHAEVIENGAKVEKKFSNLLTTFFEIIE